MNDKIMLVDELGEEQEFIILATFGLDDEDYAALIPSDDLEALTYILKMTEEDTGVVLTGIEDEEELQNAIDAFEEIQNENLQ